MKNIKNLKKIRENKKIFQEIFNFKIKKILDKKIQGKISTLKEKTEIIETKSLENFIKKRNT